GGKKSEFAGYYLHLEPGNSFIAAGSYMPEPDTLKKIRQEIDYNLDDFKKILNGKKLKETFGGPEMQYQGKQAPKGYSADNPAIEFLKLKSFILSRHVSDSEITAAGFEKVVVAELALLTPFV